MTTTLARTVSDELKSVASGNDEGVRTDGFVDTILHVVAQRDSTKFVGWRRCADSPGVAPRRAARTSSS